MAKTLREQLDDARRRIAMLEETVLAAGTLLYPESDWGPAPPDPFGRPGPDPSYLGYLHECFGDEAHAIRNAWESRGWKSA